MNWKNLFSPVRSLDAIKAKEFIRKTPLAEYQLLDVRQPKEYERVHIPGAILIPLKELPERKKELDRSKPTLVYCAIGGRSFAASQYLVAQGFNEAYNMSGGIKAWQGEKATGPETIGFELLLGNTDFADAFALAYAMENELQDFYQGMAESFEQDPERHKLFQQLVTFETKHKEDLFQYCAHSNRTDCSLPNDSAARGNILAGGYNLKNLHDAGFDTSLSSIIDLAMAMESQAMDLYSRLSRRSENDEVVSFFHHLAEEEKHHLGLLSEKLDNILEGS